MAKLVKFGVCASLLLLPLIVGCSKKEENIGTAVSSAEVVVAEVGSVKISLKEFEDEIKRYKALFRLKGMERADEEQKLKRSLLLRLIDNRAMEMEAERENIAVTKEELDKEIRFLLGEYDEAKFQLTLAENKISFDEWKVALERRIKIRKLVVDKIDSRINITEDEVKIYFKDNAEEFKWPERVRARQIMVEDETKAEQIRKKLLKKHNFAKIAMERSQSPDAADGGDLGFFSRGQMPPEFEVVVFDLKVGQISEVIKSIYGFHLFKVTKREKPHAMNYKEARGRIREILLANKREEEFKSWVKKLKSGLAIKIYWERLSLPQR